MCPTGQAEFPCSELPSLAPYLHFQNVSRQVKVDNSVIVTGTFLISARHWAFPKTEANRDRSFQKGQ
jgi:hypothetical protein